MNGPQPLLGTTGWEAMMLQKPVLVIGKKIPYLQIGQGVGHCPDLFRLPSAIRNALERPPASEKLIELFIASILYHSFDPAGLLWEKVSPGLIEANRTILENICERLETAARKSDCGAVAR